jgi:hypothetical protein
VLAGAYISQREKSFIARKDLLDVLALKGDEREDDQRLAQTLRMSSTAGTRVAVRFPGGKNTKLN